MNNALFLRRVFTLDALTCLACFVLFTFGAATLAPMTGLDTGFIRGAGIALFPCAALFLWLGTRDQPPVVISLIGIVGNFVWVAQSIAVMIAGQNEITLFGHAFIAAQAAGVLVLAILESYGLRRTRAVA